MKSRKKTAAMCAALTMAVGLTGCMLDTPDDECIVREKGMDGEAQVAAAEDGLTIENQVQAESTCKAEIEDGPMEVLVHADVKIPEGDGMKVRGTEAELFDQEDLDSWVQVLCQGKSLWNYVQNDAYDMDVTRSEMEDWIAKLQDEIVRMEQLLDTADWEDTEKLKGRIEWAQSWVDNCQFNLDSGVLPETREKAEVDWSMQNQENESYFGELDSVYDGAVSSEDQDGEMDSEEELSTEIAGEEPGTLLEDDQESFEQDLYGYVDIQDVFAPWASDEEKTYICGVTNCREIGYSRSVFSFSRRYRGDYIPWMGSNVIKNTETQISKKDMKKAADDLIDKMGLSDELKYIKSEAVYGAGVDYTPYGSHLLEDSKGWRFYYAREMEGIKITHVPNDILYEENLENFTFDLEFAFGWNDTEQFKKTDTRWDGEIFCITFDDEGLVSVIWTNPCTISENSSDNVFLLPFSEILQIFEKSITKQYVLEMVSQMDIPIKADITEIQLGYMQVASDGKPGSGQIIPVWDFIGTYESTAVKEALSDTGSFWSECYLEQKKSDSLLTINAMDGTIINWGYGH